MRTGSEQPVGFIAKKILVGTRDLLIHHGVPVLKEDFEKKYTVRAERCFILQRQES